MDDKRDVYIFALPTTALSVSGYTGIISAHSNRAAPLFRLSEFYLTAKIIKNNHNVCIL